MSQLEQILKVVNFAPKSLTALALDSQGKDVAEVLDEISQMLGLDSGREVSCKYKGFTHRAVDARMRSGLYGFVAGDCESGFRLSEVGLSLRGAVQKAVLYEGVSGIGLADALSRSVRGAPKVARVVSALFELDKEEFMSVRELAGAVGITENNLRGHLKRLADIGFLQYEKHHSIEYIWAGKDIGKLCSELETLAPYKEDKANRRFRKKVIECAQFVMERDKYRTSAKDIVEIKLTKGAKAGAQWYLRVLQDLGYVEASSPMMGGYDTGRRLLRTTVKLTEAGKGFYTLLDGLICAERMDVLPIDIVKNAMARYQLSLG